MSKVISAAERERRRKQSIRDKRLANTSNNQRGRRRRRPTRLSDEATHHYRKKNPTNEYPEQKESVSQESIRLADLLSEPMQRFCDAVVHPFGNGAIGATLPDEYQELVIPTTDRIERDFSPKDFVHPRSSSPPPSSNAFLLEGAFMWIQPRCNGAGQSSIVNLTVEDDIDKISSIEDIEEVPSYLTRNKTSRKRETYEAKVGAPVAVQVRQFPLESVNATTVEAVATAELEELQASYMLCITGQWTTVEGKQWGLYYKDGNAASGYITHTILSIPYDRFKNIDGNTSKLRLLGAGLKVWSEEAPINTGGYCLGGWITVDDIMEGFEIGPENVVVDDNAAPAVNPLFLESVQTKMKYACRNPGVKGATVRYSPLQDKEQLDPEYPLIPTRELRVTDGTGTGTAGFLYPYEVRPKTASSLAIHDVITPGSYVPCIYWNYNSKDTLADTNGAYSLKIMSIAHSEATPNGNCPFMSNKNKFDPFSTKAKMMLENPDKYPAAVAGHSFRSFMSTAKHVTAMVASYATKTMKMMALAESLFL